MLVYHAIASANHDRKVFADPDVVSDLFRGFEAVAERGAQVLAYAIMPSHMHSLIGVEEQATLGPTMKRLTGPVAQGLNRRLEQRGAIFAHSFWRAPVER